MIRCVVICCVAIHWVVLRYVALRCDGNGCDFNWKGWDGFRTDQMRFGFGFGNWPRKDGVGFVQRWVGWLNHICLSWIAGVVCRGSREDGVGFGFCTWPRKDRVGWRWQCKAFRMGWIGLVGISCAWPRKDEAGSELVLARGRIGLGWQW